MNEYLDIKNKAIEDSKSMNFEGMSGTEKEQLALSKVKELEEGLNITAQMVYTANLLIPDDEEFLKNYSENKSVKSLAQKYGYSDFIINTKIEELKDRINAMEDQKEGESNMEEFNMEAPKFEEKPLTEEIVPEEVTNNNLSMESFDLKPNEEVAGQKSSNLQETVDALADLGSVFKANNNQEETISNLNETIDELRQEKENLIQSNKDKDAEINLKEETIEEFKRAKADLEDELAKRDETIKDLNEENANKDKTIRNLEEDNSKKDSKIEELNNKNEEQTKEINILNATINEKDAIIADRDETIENNVMQFDTLNKKFLILRDENEAKDRTIREQQKTIADLENVKADYTQLVSTIKEFAASKSDQNGPRLAA